MIKYGYSNGKSKFCEIEDETLEHLVYDCETLDGIWEHVEGKLNDAKIKNNRHTVNKVISIVKWMIWKRRNS